MFSADESDKVNFYPALSPDTGRLGKKARSMNEEV